jgi:lysophospholipase L1-like esterase
MNLQYLLAILFSIFVLLSVSVWSVYYEKTYIETFDQPQKKTIILLGDSMLENKLYVEKGKSIAELLKKMMDQNTILDYAVDGTTISGVYQQIKEIPADLNNANTYVFLSSGGNDIIDKAHKGSTNENIDSIFADYTKMVDAVKTKMNPANIILLNLYYPKSDDYKSYYRMITDWNKKLKEFSKNNNLQILETSNLLDKADDFTSKIEPSLVGGTKIASAISSLVN